MSFAQFASTRTPSRKRYVAATRFAPLVWPRFRPKVCARGAVRRPLTACAPIFSGAGERRSLPDVPHFYRHLGARLANKFCAHRFAVAQIPLGNWPLAEAIELINKVRRSQTFNRRCANCRLACIDEELWRCIDCESKSDGGGGATICANCILQKHASHVIRRESEFQCVKPIFGLKTLCLVLERKRAQSRRFSASLTAKLRRFSSNSLKRWRKKCERKCSRFVATITSANPRCLRVQMLKAVAEFESRARKLSERVAFDRNRALTIGARRGAREQKPLPRAFRLRLQGDAFERQSAACRSRKVALYRRRMRENKKLSDDDRRRRCRLIAACCHRDNKTQAHKLDIQYCAHRVCLFDVKILPIKNLKKKLFACCSI